MSKGFTLIARSLDHDFARHLGMNRAKVGKRSRFAEGERVVLIRIEHLGLEHAFRAHDRVGNIVSIGPCHGGPCRHRQRPRPKAEVIDLHFSGGRRCLLSIRPLRVRFAGTSEL